MTTTLQDTFRNVQAASRKLSLIDEDKVNTILRELARRIPQHAGPLLEANGKDLDRMSPDDPKFDRLKLTEDRLTAIARDVENVAALPSPLGQILEERTTASGLHLRKITVPLGVVGIIYEARPNVTFDVFALCLKSGNACVLKGGSDADYSNRAIVNLIHTVLKDLSVDTNIIALLPPDREATSALLNAVGFVDIIIPRGSQNLINYVRENATVPVIETGAGIVHTYFHHSGDVAKGKDIIYNAKTRRVSVCNALDCLIIDKSRLADLAALTDDLQNKNVTIFADEPAFAVLEGRYAPSLLKHANSEHFGTEFLDYKMSIRTVSDLEEALDHINTYSSRHSEAIIAEDESVIDLFLRSVDAAAVYANVSTAFTDGAQFGLGAEIGISTQKLHARGPMALREMTSYKWLVRGDGTVRIP